MTAMTMAGASSPSKKSGLRGPRPQPLKVASAPPSSRPSNKRSHGGGAPVIVYEHTPKVVHARPHEFMTVVQRLTGKPAPAPALLPGYDVPIAPMEEGAGVGDPLLLTLGHGQHPPMAAGPGQLMSPGGFIFSPNTMQSIQELCSTPCAN